jgi:hypothetical protein
MTSTAPGLLAAANALQSFAGAQLTSRVAALETAFAGTDAGEAHRLLGETGTTHDLLASAYLLKRIAGQIHVVIHAVGILLCLPHLLEPGEQIEYLSLGAGNTGKAFDLETNLRVAEFKFIHWQGGAEVIRQNGLFKDLYFLAEHATTKRKYMYVLDTTHPLKFLRGGRSLSSVVGGSRKLRKAFQARYGTRFSSVGEYYSARGGDVSLVSVSGLLSELAADAPALPHDSSAFG